VLKTPQRTGSAGNWTGIAIQAGNGAVLIGEKVIGVVK